MSIECGGHWFTPTCDQCGDTLDPETEFIDAVHAKKQEGWRSRKIDGEWIDLCCDCQRQERDAIDNA